MNIKLTKFTIDGVDYRDKLDGLALSELDKIYLPLEIGSTVTIACNLMNEITYEITEDIANQHLTLTLLRDLIVSYYITDTE